MNRVQKQSIMIVIGSIEQQLVALKSLLCMGDNDVNEAPLKSQAKASHSAAMNYTSEDEDFEIAQALQLADEKKHAFIEDMFRTASKEVEDATVARD